MKHPMLRVLLLPDKFKGSLAAEGVIGAIRSGILTVLPQSEIHSVIVSDGGDGFLHAISKQLDCDTISIQTDDPLGRRISANYLWDTEHNTAYIEMAKASGLELLSENERKVMKTSTYGTGLQIKDAIAKGAVNIYVGLGGSATNDGGIGIAAALGFDFLDREGNRVVPVGENLNKLHSIGKSKDAISLKNVSIFAVNDVDNPLCGKNGAAHTYGRQKGASDTEIETLDEGLELLSQLVKEQLHKDAAKVSGAGAAGGTAYGLKVFLDAGFIPGTEFLFKITELEELLATKQFDYIVTGEGKLDAQTANGKLIKGVVNLGKKHKVPVIAVCGKSELGEERYRAMGLHTVLQTLEDSMTLDFSMQHTGELIKERISNFFKKNSDPKNDISAIL